MEASTVAPAPSRSEVQPSIARSEHPVATALAFIRDLDCVSRRTVASRYRHAADLLDHIARDEGRMSRLVKSTLEVPSQHTRDAILEAFGFDYETAVGFGLRVANLWPIFRGGWAAMHKRPPVSVEEAASVLRTRALELQVVADAFLGSQHPDPAGRQKRLLQVQRLGLDETSVLLDGVTGLADIGTAGSVGLGLVKTGLDEAVNDKQWELDKSLALAGYLDLQQFEQARARYTKQYALNRISFITMALRYSGTLVTLFGAVTGDNAAPGLSRKLTVLDLMEKANTEPPPEAG